MTFFLPYIVINKLTVASYKSELQDNTNLIFFLRVLTDSDAKKNNYDFISHNSEKRGQSFFFWKKVRIAKN